ncbi:DUF881 domain-containing protein [Bacillus sp. V59.32b]|uniref:DUF881 domain-containing protein n=1 Tax=Bacillus sp. V59.32b TaxID=1758642 RepID=UPI000E3D378D|nr:DUF881 domain-containing protein [Bacillus sp. V59.32b]RFU68771.1 DUF881 domain-containing protein [Bacillus sp. V59.32b]
MPMKVKGKQVILSLVCLVLGFMVAFSFNLTQRENNKPDAENKGWDREYQLRAELIEQEEKNRELQKELIQKQSDITAIEKELSQEARVFFNLAEDTEKYRLFLGKVKVKGKGVEVTLEDGAADEATENPNSYIVHEQHVFNVVNELYISGATAVAINGQRLKHNSYIVCDGPVITVDGRQHPAPFIISAIGSPDVLAAALNLSGGVKDQLVNDNIVFKLERQDNMILDPTVGS